MTNYVAQTEWTEDQAIERFNDDMSNATDSGDRKLAAHWLAHRLEQTGMTKTRATERAAAMKSAWLEQLRNSR